MITTRLIRSRLAFLVPEKRQFSVSLGEIHALDAKIRRKINVLKMMNKDREFTYEKPEMIYDKATGDVTILPKKIKKKSKVITNYEDYEKEKMALFEELGVPEGDIEKVNASEDL